MFSQIIYFYFRVLIFIISFSCANGGAKNQAQEILVDEIVSHRPTIPVEWSSMTPTPTPTELKPSTIASIPVEWSSTITTSTVMSQTFRPRSSVYDCPKAQLPEALKFLCNTDPEIDIFGGPCLAEENSSLNFLISPLSSSVAAAMMDTIPSSTQTQNELTKNILNLDADGDSILFLKAAPLGFIYNWNSSNRRRLYTWPNGSRKTTQDGIANRETEALVVFPKSSELINLCLTVQHPTESPVRITKKILISNPSSSLSMNVGNTNKEYKLAFKETFKSYKTNQVNHNFWNLLNITLPDSKTMSGTTKTNYLNTFGKDFVSPPAWKSQMFKIENASISGSSGSDSARSGLKLSVNVLKSGTSPDGSENWSESKIINYLKYISPLNANLMTRIFQIRDFYIKIQARLPQTPIPNKQRISAFYTYFYPVIDVSQIKLGNPVKAEDGVEIDAIEAWNATGGTCGLESTVHFDHDFSNSKARSSFTGSNIFQDEALYPRRLFSGENYKNYCTANAYDAMHQYSIFEWLDSGSTIQIKNTIGKNTSMENINISKGDTLCRAIINNRKNKRMAIPAQNGDCPSYSKIDMGTSIENVSFPGGSKNFVSLNMGLGFASWANYNASTLTLENAKAWFDDGMIIYDVEVWLAQDNYEENYVLDYNQYLAKWYTLNKL